ncbi:MFS transporter [Geofilum sp. OHC36d9]|uniref:MFS transporter n=1 Tax=Geofilum sp. OHC36d9 TaxID=3458413 RepID=UPI004034C71C
MKENHIKSGWAWIPSLYFAEGLPYVIVMTVAVIMYKRLGLSNTNIALYTSWLYIPWVIKPFWSPTVDLLKTKRWWIVTMQLVIGAGLAGVAFTIPTTHFIQYTLAFFWLMAFSSATHDIAADGFYMLGLTDGDQAYFVGIRSTFYRVAMISGQGLLVIVAGYFENLTGNIAQAWSITFWGITILFLLLCLFHKMILPHPPADQQGSIANGKQLFIEFIRTFESYYKKPHFWPALAFMLFFRMGEAQLVKLASPFMLDATVKGGLGLTTSQVGLIYGTIGIIALTLGGIAGGVLTSRHGLRRWIFTMAIAMNLPNVVYVFLAWFTPGNIWLISSAVAVEQFGYGFGFTAYLLFLIYFSDGKHKTAHYAISTGIMAIGMMLPGMISGWIQESIGYLNFFIWVLLCTIPGFVIIRYLSINPTFGIKRKS